MKETSFSEEEDLNYKSGFVRELEEIKHIIVEETIKNEGKEEFQHLQRNQYMRFALFTFGICTAWYSVNPLSVFSISLFHFLSWMCAHHILHRGYDKIPNIPAKWTSKHYAKGIHRWIDWPDWIEPRAWVQEHNTLHHYKLGETHDTDYDNFSVGDPDLLENITEKIRSSKLPKILKYMHILFIASFWKIVYYAPNTIHACMSKEMEKKEDGSSKKLGWPLRFSFIQPLSDSGRRIWTQCFLPYIAIFFILFPGLFFIMFGYTAAKNVFINMFIAEIMTNLHSFITIATNHTGSDLYRYSKKYDNNTCNSRFNFYCRQIMGSVNFHCGGEMNDLMHGWLNYQIEHHMWPDMTMLQYRRAHPMVKSVAQKYGIPYVQESIWIRIVKTLKIMVGDESMINITCPCDSLSEIYQKKIS